MESMRTSAFLASFLVLLIVFWLFGRRLPRRYRDRSCQGAAWRRAFPAASTEQIRAFLSTVAGAFVLRDSERLKLAPGDRVLDLYRARYPDRGTPDMLELETLARLVEERYGVALDDAWSDGLTLGALFAHCTRSRPATNDGAAKESVPAS